MNPENAAVTAGVLTGGWEYIWAAFGITWLTFALYGLSLVLRQRRANQEQS